MKKHFLCFEIFGDDQDIRSNSTKYSDNNHKTIERLKKNKKNE